MTFNLRALLVTARKTWLWNGANKPEIHSSRSASDVHNVDFFRRFRLTSLLGHTHDW